MSSTESLDESAHKLDRSTVGEVRATVTTPAQPAYGHGPYGMGPFGSVQEVRQADEEGNGGPQAADEPNRGGE